jgi:ribosomal protein S18 acetylase RimI-like enzyme
MEIRELTASDAEAFRVVRLEGLQLNPEAFGSSYEEQKDRPLSSYADRLRDSAATPDAFTLGAFEGGLVGTAGFVRDQGAKMRHKGMIWGVYVAQHARGRGVARALMDESIGRARAMPGLEQIYLTVMSTNEPALRLYRALGFETYGRERRALKIGETYYDEDLMVLWLA